MHVEQHIDLVLHLMLVVHVICIIKGVLGRKGNATHLRVHVGCLCREGELSGSFWAVLANPGRLVDVAGY